MPTDAELVLVLNSGSSSVKFALVDPATGDRAVDGLCQRVGGDDATVVVRRRGDEETSIVADDASHRGVVAALLSALLPEERAGIAAAGHRVVHGGPQFTESRVVTGEVLSALDEMASLAPLHWPANRAGIEAVSAEMPGLPQVAVFDTAYHHTIPPVAYRYAVPTEWYERHHVRRYGFHGTSLRYVVPRVAGLLDRPLESLRMVVLHLGNGCSATAVRDGVSVDTTMGLTPLEGLVMGSRSGDVDPGLIGYVAERLGLDIDGVLRALNEKSGLLGLSGVSNDMRTLVEESAKGSGTAAQAIDVFCYRAAKAVAALSVAVGRLDALVFTGGIGENAVEVRSAVIGRLALLDLTEDVAANAAHGRSSGGRISSGDYPVALVVPTDEELVIARDTAEMAT